MRKQVILTSLTLLMMFMATALFAQVGINTDGSQPDPSAMLDVKSSSKGFLPPRVELTSLDVASPIASPVATGLLVFNTATQGTAPNNVIPGYYFWNANRWVAVGTPKGAHPGEMLCWNGFGWESLPIGNHGQQLYFCNGEPTWGGCYAVLTASPVTNITASTAVAGGYISSNGGSPVTERGICWGTSPNPSILNSKLPMGSGTGAFNGQITGLTSNTTYYIRAYATNIIGTAYASGIDSIFSTGIYTDAPATASPTITACPGEFVDIPISVAGFNDIGSVTLTLHYNPSTLTYTSATNTSGYAGLAFNGSVPGVVTISGISTSGVTFPDNTVLFTLHCTYLGGLTGLTWFDNGSSCEYLAGDMTLLNDEPKTTFYLDGEVNESVHVGSPAFTAGTISSRCQGAESVAYPATAANSSGITYSLDAVSTSAGNSIDPATGTVTYAASWAGTSVVTASALGCTGPKTSDHTVTVHQQLPVSVSISPSANYVCAGTSVTFSASPINGGTSPAYQWKVNGVNAGTDSDTYTYLPANNDIVTCTLNSVVNCATGSPASSNAITMTMIALVPVMVTISPSANSICSGTVVTFNANTINGGSSPSYQWKVNGTAVGTNNPVFSYMPANNDLVTCTVTSGASCISGNPAVSNTITMHVEPLLPVSVSIASSANPVCAGTAVTYTATAVNGGDTPSYQWKVNGTNAGANSNIYTISPLNNDVVSCVLLSSTTCTSGNPGTSNAINMIVNPLLTVSVSIAPSATSVCAGTPVTYTASATNGGTTPAFQWYVNGASGGANNPVFIYTPVNGDAITCMLTSNAVCTTGNQVTSNSVVITVNPLLPVSLSISASGSSVCAGSPVTLTAVPVNGGTTPVYQWKVNGNIAGPNGPVFSYNPQNGDAITCSLTSSETCATGNPATTPAVIIDVNPLLPVSVTVAPSSNPICAGTSVIYTATAINGGTSPVYQWKVNGLNAGSNGNTYYYTPANNDVVACVLTSDAICATGSPANSNTVTMTVNPLVPVSISVVASETSVCAGTPVTYTASATNGGTTPAFQWYVNGASGGANNPVFIYTPVNGDAITCMLTSNAVCTTGNQVTSNSVVIIVNPLLPVSLSISASGSSVCAGSPVTLTAVPVNGGTTPVYQWKVNGNTTGPNGPVFSYNPQNGDAITCSLTSSETCATGNPATTPAVIIDVNPLLPVSVTVAPSSNPVCAGTSVIYTATAINGGTSPVYQWKVNGLNAGSNGNTYYYTPANNDVVACVLTSDAICATGSPANSNAVAMTVNPLAPASISIVASETSVCAGTTVIYTASLTNGGTSPVYQWKVNGVNAGTNSAAYSRIPANNDVVTCILTSNANCATGNPASSNAIGMIVNPLLPVGLTLSTSANPVCAGTPVTYTATPINGGTSPVYQWKVNGTNAGPNEPLFTYVPVNGELITCTLISSETCTTGNTVTTNPVTMIVHPLLPVSISIIPSANPVCAGTLVTYNALPVNGGYSPVFQWFINGVNTSSNSNSYTYIPESNDIVTCLLTSNETCTTGNPATSNSIPMTVNPVQPVSVSIAASSNPVCAGTNVTFTATQVNGGTMPVFQWKVNGVDAGANSGSFSCNPVNGDAVTCQLTSNATCATGSPANSNSIGMIVNPLLPVGISISASANPVCSGSTVILTATPVNGGSSPVYQWKVNGTPAGPNEPIFSYSPVSGDLLTCTLTSSEACVTGNPATSQPVTFVVNPLLPVSITITPSANPVCAGTMVTFSAVPVNGGPLPVYQWRVNGIIAGTNSPDFSFMPSNSDVITCRLISDANCSTGNPANSNSISMVVNPLLPVSIAVTPSANPVCANTQVIFTAIGVNVGTTPSYQWKVNGSNVNEAVSTSYAYIPANNDVITCVLTSSEVCATGSPATSNTVTMTVSPMLPVSITVAASANPVCAGTTVTFTATPVNGGLTPVYQWSVNGNSAGNNSPSYAYVPATGDQVRCLLTSSALCNTGNPATSNTLSMSVNPLQPVSLTISASANNVCAGTPVTYTATPVNGGTPPAYQWKVNGVSTGTNNALFTYTPTSGDQVSCVMTSNINCANGNPATSNVIPMTVNPLLTVGLSISASGSPVCAGTSVTYTATPVNGGTSPVYQWKVNGISQGPNGPVFTYVPVNGDVLTCTLTSSESCTSANPITTNPITLVVNASMPVSVSATASSNPVCAGTLVTFTANPVNGGTTPVYQWKVNGANISGATGATYAYSPANNDMINCVLTSGLTCTTGNPATSNILTETVNPTVPVSVTISASANNVCAGLSVTYTATPVNPGLNPAYQWKVNGTNVPGATTAAYTYAPVNGHAISCSLTSNASCPTGNPALSNVITMVINPLLPVSVSIAASANPTSTGTTVTYTATPVNGGSNPAYQWKVNGINVPGATNVTYVYIPLNTDVITCVLSSNAVCPTGNPAISNTVTMVVNELLPVSVTIVASANPVCAASSVTYTATPVNGGTAPAYQWKVNGTNVSGATNVTYSYVPANGNMVSCVLTSSEVFTTGNPATSNVITMTVIPSVAVSVTVAASANPVCSGTTVTFTATPVNGGSAPAYQWKVNGTNIPGATNVTYVYTPANNDMVTCILISNETCTTGNPATSNTVAMIVNANLPVSVTVSASANPTCTGASVTFTATPVNGGTNPVYQWKVNGTDVPGATNDTYTYSPANSDAVACRLTSSQTCTTGNPATGTINMVVNGSAPASVTVAASVNPSCSGATVTFTATAVNGGTTPSYQWKVNGNNQGPNNPVYTYVPLTGDMVTCVMTSNLLCATGSPATSTPPITMVVNAPVAVSASITASLYAVMPSTSVTYTATSVNGGATPSYQWKVNALNSGTNSATFTYTPADHDKVTCVVTSNLTGCLSTNPATSNQIVAVVYTTGTACPGIPTVTYSGKTYNTVQIGTQCWLRENLDLGTRINGTSQQTNNSVIEKYCYGNSDMNCNVYGGLYQWAELVQYLNNATNTTNWSPVPTGNVQGLCPAGWHIPTNTEWGAMMTYLGGISLTGGKIKEATNAHFGSPNTGATNSSGFTALPGGCRWSSGLFYYITNDANHWTVTSGGAATDIYYGGASYSINAATNGQFYKVTGLSVRCLKD